MKILVCVETRANRYAGNMLLFDDLSEMECLRKVLEDAESISEQILEDKRSLTSFETSYDTIEAQTYMEPISDSSGEIDGLKSAWVLEEVPTYIADKMTDDYQEALVDGEGQAMSFLSRLPRLHRTRDFLYSIRPINLRQ